jgi:hypothetical protein
MATARLHHERTRPDNDRYRGEDCDEDERRTEHWQRDHGADRV